jgi:hypothetical protein
MGCLESVIVMMLGEYKLNSSISFWAARLSKFDLEANCYRIQNKIYIDSF